MCARTEEDDEKTKTARMCVVCVCGRERERERDVVVDVVERMGGKRVSDKQVGGSAHTPRRTAAFS